MGVVLNPAINGENLGSATAPVNVVFPSTQEIVISAADDSIAIGDGTRNVTVTAANALKVDGSAVTQPVSMASAPLPSGAATAAKQDTGNTSLASIDTKTPSAYATQTSIINGDAQTVTFDCRGMSTLTVNISGLYSGTLFFSGNNLNGAGGVSNGLNVGQNDGIGVSDNRNNNNDVTGNGTWVFDVSGFSTFYIDSSGVNSNSTTVYFYATPTTGVLTGIIAPVVIQGSLTDVSGTISLPTGAATATKQDTGNATLSTINNKITAVDTGAVVVASSALPSGASTSGKQDTGNTSVASIDTKTPALGQAAMAASTPIVIASNQTSIPVAATLTAETTKVIGTVNISASQSVSIAAGAASIGVLGANSGTDIGDVTINNASGASAVNIQDGGNSITVDAVTLTSIDGKTPSLGQALSVASQPVVFASDQSAIPASQSGVWTVQPGNTANTTAWKVDGSAVTQPISADSLPLPTSAAQEAGNLAIVADVLQLMLMELRAMRYALTTLVCEGGRNNPEDFDPSYNQFDGQKFN